MNENYIITASDINNAAIGIYSPYKKPISIDILFEEVNENMEIKYGNDYEYYARDLYEKYVNNISSLK